MPQGRYYKTIVLVGVLLLLAEAVACGADDGFVAAKRITAEHFTILYQADTDIFSLIEALNISPSDKLLAGRGSASGLSPEAELAEALDTLFIRVCDTLDMRLYKSFQGTIKICSNNEALCRTYFNLFSSELNSNYPFYVHSFNTIYISAENFTVAMLGHEIAHAVISHYFVVLPSVKIQEVLAGYVEYQLRKNSGRGPAVE
jgi:hypothetical protein